MSFTCHTRPKGQVHDADALPTGDKQRFRAAESGSSDLKRALNMAIGRFATSHGIRMDQARALLMDRVAVQ